MTNSVVINNVIETNDNALEWFQTNCWTLMKNMNHACEICSKQYESMEGQKNPISTPLKVSRLISCRVILDSQWTAIMYLIMNSVTFFYFFFCFSVNLNSVMSDLCENPFLLLWQEKLAQDHLKWMSKCSSTERMKFKN